MVVDHINRNTFDCRLSNLRYCSFSLNGHNRDKHSSCLSTYKGVFPMDKITRKCWMCTTTFDSETYYLGVFQKEIDAAYAFNQKIMELHGDNGLLNDLEHITRNDDGVAYLRIGLEMFLFDDDDWEDMSIMPLTLAHNGMLVINCQEEAVAIHDLIFPPDPNHCIIHVDGDFRNHRRENLKQVHYNDIEHDANITYRGVLERKNNRWRVNIYSGNTHFTIGTYGSPHEAAYQYNLKASELHREDAVLNYIFPHNL